MGPERAESAAEGVALLWLLLQGAAHVIAFTRAATGSTRSAETAESPHAVPGGGAVMLQIRTSVPLLLATHCVTRGCSTKLSRASTVPVWPCSTASASAASGSQRRSVLSSKPARMKRLLTTRL